MRIVIFSFFRLECLLKALHDPLNLVAYLVLRVLERYQVDRVDLEIGRWDAFVLVILAFERCVEELGGHRLTLGFQLVDIVVLRFKKPPQRRLFSTTSGHTRNRVRDRVDSAVPSLEVSRELGVDFQICMSLRGV